MGPRDFEATLTSKALLKKELCIKPQERAGQSPLPGIAKLAVPPSTQLSSCAPSSPLPLCKSLAQTLHFTCSSNILSISSRIPGFSINWKSLSIYSLPLHLSIFKTSIMFSSLSASTIPPFHVLPQPFPFSLS